MNEDTLNMSIRKFLKKVGITSQREIEKAVNISLGKGDLSGDGAFQVRVILEAAELGLKTEINGTIELE